MEKSRLFDLGAMDAREWLSPATAGLMGRALVIPVLNKLLRSPCARAGAGAIDRAVPDVREEEPATTGAAGMNARPIPRKWEACGESPVSSIRSSPGAFSDVRITQSVLGRRAGGRRSLGPGTANR
jgi:hypothetical protein